jgi:hypothetical protein
MTTLNDFLFAVELVNNPAITNKEYSRMVMMPDSGKVLNYCSPRFNLLKNQDVFPVIEKYLDDAKCGYIKAYSMNGYGTSFHAKYIIKTVNGTDVGISVGADADVIYPSVDVDNSYSGLKQAMFAFGYFRMICSNGMVIPVEGQEDKNLQIKGKHTEKLSLSFGQLIQKLNGFLSMQGTFKKRFEVLCDTAVKNYGDRVEEVLNATKVSATQLQTESILNTITKETKELGYKTPNEWIVYNAINAHIYKAVSSTGKTKKATPDIKRGIDNKVLTWMLNDVNKKLVTAN